MGEGEGREILFRSYQSEMLYKRILHYCVELYMFHSNLAIVLRFI